jgi:hypothetical protein
MQEVEEREGGLWVGKFHLMFHRLDKYHAEYRYAVRRGSQRPSLDSTSTVLYVHFMHEIVVRRSTEQLVSHDTRHWHDRERFSIAAVLGPLFRFDSERKVSCIVDQFKL